MITEMAHSIVMYDPAAVGRQPRRIIEIDPHAGPPTRHALLAADAVVLSVPSLDTYPAVQQGIAELYKGLAHPAPPILLRVNTCLDATTSGALNRFDTTVGRGSALHLGQVWFVGTDDGLRGLINDLRALGYGDGVSIVTIEDITAPRAIAS
jgi:hypothetical protein